MPRQIDSDAEINSIRIKEQSSAPATPDSGYGQIYAKTDGKLYFKDDAGNDRILTGNITSIVSNNGAWCWFSDPRSIYYNGKTYFGYVNSTGSICIKGYDHINKTLLSETILHANLETDDHNNPSILIRNSDKKIIAFYSTHDGNDKVIRYRISSNAESISSFDAEQTFDPASGTARYSYTNPVQLTGETNSPIYLFYRRHDTSYNNAYMARTKSVDDGATWDSQVLIAFLTYHKVAQNENDRIDFALSNHPDDPGDHSIYHFYYRGGNYYKTDGTQIVSSLPFSTSDLTEVYDGSSIKGWIWDIAIEPVTGYPIIVYATFQSTSDHRYNYARWNGSSWDTQEITPAGGYLYAAQPYYSGGISLDHDDPNIVYLSKYVGSQFEFYKGVTNDNGTSWQLTPITTNSNNKQIRPIAVRESIPDLVSLWLDGTYTSYTNYDLDIMRLRDWEENDDDIPTLLIQDNGAFVVSGGGISFDQDLIVTASGSIAHVEIPVGTFASGSHTHPLGSNAIQVFDDSIFKVSGTAISFDNNLTVISSGTVAFVSSTVGGGGIPERSIPIYDEHIFIITGTAIDFVDNLSVVASGSVAFISSTGGGGGSGLTPVFDNGVFKVSGTAISFDDNLTVVSTGTVAFVNSTGGTIVAGEVEHNNSGSYSTNSTSWANIDGTNLKVVLTTGAHRCLIGFVGMATNSDGAFFGAFDIAIDGTRVGVSDHGAVATMENTNRTNVSFTILSDVLSAGEHTFTVQWKSQNSSNTVSLYANFNNAWGPRLWAVETLATV